MQDCLCFHGSNMLHNLNIQVRVYDLASMSCSYVLAGHTEIVICLDTCVSSSGRTLIATGSRDKSVSFHLKCLAIIYVYFFPSVIST